LPEFCLFCETGREPDVENFLAERGFAVITSLVERNVARRGEVTREPRPLIPGYVFFESDAEPDWKSMKKECAYVYYPLRYSDASTALRGEDAAFVYWLRREGVIGISKAVRVGTKIRIVEGPLKRYEGNIVTVNSRQKCVEVRIAGEGIVNTMWLSYEVIEPA